jgi:cell division protein DivIC
LVAGCFLYIYTSDHFFMKFIRHTVNFLRNKYFLATTCFVLWMLFFDRNDLFTQLQRRRELSAIQHSKAYFNQKIAEDRKFSNDLQFNASAIEKYAREKYLMKRDNEDLFLVQPLERK